MQKIVIRFNLFKKKTIASLFLKESEGVFESTVELTPTTIVNDACAYYKSAPVINVDKVRTANKVSVVKFVHNNIVLIRYAISISRWEYTTIKSINDSTAGF